MRYQISKGKKSFSGETLFDNLTLEIKDKQKVAIIGRNGSGKSTILKIMAGLEELDSGDIHVDKNLSIGYLSQVSIENDDLTVEEEFSKSFEKIKAIEDELAQLSTQLDDEKALNRYGELQHLHESLGGYTYQNEMHAIFTKFGFELSDLNRKLSTFSGGQKTRIAFVKLLISKPDILLLDEPTNHLDLETIKWLEGYIKNYPKAVVMVSHDRIFIDEIVDTVYELELGNLRRYQGNYTSYKEQKKKELENNAVAYANQQKEIADLQRQIDKFRSGNKAKFAQSKIKYLERMDKIDKIQVDDKKFKVNFYSRIKGGNQVLSVQDLSIGYDQSLLSSLSFEVIRGQRIAVVGKNGCGKSTLLKTLMGEIPAISGDYLFGHQIEVGYFDQNLADYTGDITVLDNLWSAYPELKQTEVRTILGCLLFSGDDVLKTLDVLSGGEKVRLALAHLMLRHDNMLVLDEPTNHLDILGKEALEDCMLNYDGTMFFVSHDRYFIKKMATHVLDLSSQQKRIVPIDQLDDNNHVDKNINQSKNKVEKTPNKNINNNINYGKEVSKLERMINKKEQQLEEYRELRYEPEFYQDSSKMQELDNAIDEIHNELNALMEKWELYSELMEEQKNLK